MLGQCVFSLKGNWPADLDRDYYLVAKIDSQSQVAKDNETNNASPLLPGTFLVRSASQKWASSLARNTPLQRQAISQTKIHSPVVARSPDLATLRDR